MNDEEFLHSGRRVRSADAAVFKAVEHEAALERKAQRAEHQDLNLVPRQYQRPEENKAPGHQQPEAVKSPRTSEVRTPRIFYLAVERAVMVAVVQQALLNHITLILLKLVGQKFKRVMLLKKENYNAYLELKKLVE